MNYKWFGAILVVAIALGTWGCEDTATTGAVPGGTVAQVQGKIFDNTTHLPLSGASVYSTNSLGTDSISTTADGGYDFLIDLGREASLTGSLQIRKNGYRSKSLTYLAIPGNIIYNDVYLDRDTTTGVVRNPGTGLARSIALIGVSNKEISVYGVGGIESSILTWEVRDSLGFPIDIDHTDTVSFVIVGAPVAGGAYISPAMALTNAAGRVATIINSGTVSGSVQFVASLRRDVDGTIVQSTPSLITVNGGLPDQTHFTVAPDQINFAGYDWEGREDRITVQVGDIYSNPVKVGTAVYFSTTGGVIMASGFTDATSHASVILYSGNPRPDDPVLGRGFAYVRASTLGQGSTVVMDSARILFSGVPIISNVNPATFHVSQGQSTTITFTVSDENGNPLAPGEVISAVIQYTPPSGGTGTSIQVTGQTVTVMPDTHTRGSGTTQFSINVVDQSNNGGLAVSIPVSVLISATGPNGTAAQVSINGTVGGP
jgi:hypothetical protein